MPRDAHSPTRTHNSQSTAAPLKRGDACLYCRKRRIKCSAEKPTCNNCTKLKRECVYDAGKPVSRVKQLEDKVQELEEMLKAGPGGILVNNLGNGGESNASSSRRDSAQPPPLQHHSSSEVSGQTDSISPPERNSTSYSMQGQSGGENTFHVGAIPSVPTPSINFGNESSIFSGFGGSVFHPTPAPPPQYQHQSQQSNAQFSYMSESQQFQFGNGGMASQAFSGVDPAAVEMFDFTTLDPNLMDLINSFGSTNTDQPDLPTQNDQGLMEVDPFGNGSTGLTPFLDPTNGQGLSPPAPPQNVSPTNNPSVSTGSTSSYPQPVSIQPLPSYVSTSYMASINIPDTNPTPSSQSRSSTQQSSMEPDETHIPRGSNPSFGISGYHSSAPEADPRSKLPQPKDMSGGWRQWREDPAVPELDETMGLVGNWFDAADLPKVARDHLLDLFFAGMRMFGQEFHIPRFFASLSLPPAKRPHPCLLYTMYLMASRISSSVPIRSLEPHFYAIATTKLEESIAHSDRLFDAVRAATILAVYKYSLARYHEGWMLTGQAVRLAISCGLHVIPFSGFKPSPLPNDYRADLVGLMRQRAFVLPPPVDAIALGERIWAFWSIFTVDRCGAISAQWPVGIPDNIITTPYPRPLYEYELGLINTEDDIPLISLYEQIDRPPLPYYAESTYIQIRMRAMSILDRASKLNYLKPERGWQDRIRESTSSSVSPGAWGFDTSPSGWGDDIEQYLNTLSQEANSQESRRGSETQKGKGWMRCAKIRTPKAYEEILAALRRIEEDLPPERRTNWEVWDGTVQDWHFGGKSRRELFVLHFIVGCSWMFLFDVFSFNAPNDQAVGVARRLSFTVKQIMNDNMGGDLDVFIAMCWSFIVKVLIREVKRLQSLGQLATAAPMEEEIETIVQALAIFGKRYNIASYQVHRTNQYRQSTLQDLKFMENDELDEHHIKMPGDPATYRDNGVDLSVKGAATMLGER